MVRNPARAVRSAVSGRSPVGEECARRRRGWRSGARSACAIAVAFIPLLASLGACDVTLSATASIGQPCQIDEDCPPGQRCLGTPKGTLCELADADATVANDGAPQPGSGFAEGEPPLEVDASDADVTDLGAQDDGEADASGDAASDADASDVEAQGEADASGDAASDADASDIGAQHDGEAEASCMTPFPPSTLVLFGGQGNQFFGDTWSWNGASWSQVDAGDAVNPPPRQAAAMATACGYAVLVGGTGPLPNDGGSPIKGDAWLWNGSLWQPAAPPPTARSAGAAATLGFTLYLFGGEGPGGIDPTESGLLTWDGIAWSTPPQSSPLGPAPRVFPVVVSVEGGLLVFGGQDAYGDAFPDTWLLNATSWQELDDGGADSGPALGAAGATSVGGSSVVMFGGLDENYDTLGDTWLWNGGAWSKVPADGGPPPRAYPAMGTLNGQVVMFGGQDENSHPLGDTWLWDGGSWVRGPDAGPLPRTAAAMTAY